MTEIMVDQSRKVVGYSTVIIVIIIILYIESLSYIYPILPMLPSILSLTLTYTYRGKTERPKGFLSPLAGRK